MCDVLDTEIRAALNELCENLYADGGERGKELTA
jgi:hypothetical protein